jgi:uncharacterized protein (DUF697 family)
MMELLLDSLYRARMGVRAHMRTVRVSLESAAGEVTQLGGWHAFRTGEWLPRLVRHAFRHYYERADRPSLARTHGSRDTELLAERMIVQSAKDAAVLGAVVGVIVSLDEAVAIMTAGEAGLGLPANLTIAFFGIAGEAVLLVRTQLQLVAGLARVYDVSLGSEAPEDISAMLASTLGMSILETGEQAAKKVRSRLVNKFPGYVGKEVFGRIPGLGQRAGIKLFERNLMKYGAPVASLVIASSWNYATTRAVGRTAQRHLRGAAAIRAIGE